MNKLICSSVVYNLQRQINNRTLDSMHRLSLTNIEIIMADSDNKIAISKGSICTIGRPTKGKFLCANKIHNQMIASYIKGIGLENIKHISIHYVLTLTYMLIKH